MENGDFLSNFIFNHETYDKSEVGALEKAAVGAKQIFDSYVAAGFTENQALKLLGYILGTALHGTDQKGDGDV